VPRILFDNKTSKDFNTQGNSEQTDCYAKPHNDGDCTKYQKPTANKNANIQNHIILHYGFSDRMSAKILKFVYGAFCSTKTRFLNTLNQKVFDKPSNKIVLG